MSLGSAVFFVVKLVWVYLTIRAGMAAWLSYLIINVVLAILSWTYHGKFTFRAALSRKSALRYVNTYIGLAFFDYFGFLFLTYAVGISPVLSVVIMSALQFSVRFLTYANYVFHQGESKVGQTMGVSTFVLLGALLFGAVNYTLAIDDSPPQKDGKQNYCTAVNIYTFGVFGKKCVDVTLSKVPPQPSMKREPGLPALLALTFVIAGSDDDAQLCATAGPQLCKRLRISQRALLLIPFLALIILVYFAGKDITSNRNIAAVAALCTALGTGLVESSVTFLSEPLAASLLLLVAWMLYRMVNRSRPIAAGLVCGVALGLAALTKAVYFYFIPVLALCALLVFPFPSWRRAAGSGLIAVLIAALITGPWIYRNHERFGSSAIAGRDGNVMAIRAQFTTMSWQQYWAGYLVFTPKVGPELVRLFDVDPKDAAMFDRSNPDGFIQRFRRGEGPVFLPKGSDQREMRRQALNTFAENWPKQLALIPLTMYRSAFLPVGRPIAYASSESRTLRLIRSVSLTLATIIALGMIPAFFLNVAIDLWRVEFAKLAFHLPAAYSIGVHAVMTHYIPRYNLPLFGILAIELSIAAFFLCGRFIRPGRTLRPAHEGA